MSEPTTNPQLQTFSIMSQTLIGSSLVPASLALVVQVRGGGVAGRGQGVKGAGGGGGGEAGG